MKLASLNTISSVFSYYYQLLMPTYSAKEANVLLKSLIAHFTESKSYKIPEIDKDKKLNESTLLFIHHGVKDLLKMRPLEYIISKVSFYEFEFFINESVLIPRPETEELVDFIWKSKTLFSENPIGLDIGTGSGCIAISLNKIMEASMTAVDISPSALDVAKINSDNHGADIQFINLDILKSSEWDLIPDNLDFIVSNPPYVRKSENALMKKNVLNFEPPAAIFVEDTDPLIFYRAIADLSTQKLKKKGHIYLEINEFLAIETKTLFDDKFSNVDIILDLNGKSRFIHAFN